MGDFRKALLTAAVALSTLASCGCARDETLKVYVEASWSDEEIAVIRQCMDEWNRLGRRHLDRPRPLLLYAGRKQGKFSVDKLNDGIHVVYRLGSVEETPDYLRYDNAGCTGYGTLGDILIKTYAEGEGTDDYAYGLHCVVLHEFGHLLGLPHYNAEQNVMGEFDNTCDLAEVDERYFCAVYDCR